MILLLVLLSFAAQASELNDYLFGSRESESRHRVGARTEGILVIQNGRVLYEKYGRGYDQNKLHITWSISKTMTGLLYGVALKEKRVRLDQSICDFGSFLNAHFCKIKIKDVLTWSTGIKWNEEYEGAVKPTESSILAMLYGEGHRDMAEFVKSQPLEPNVAPGEVWRYSSGDSVLAASLLKGVFKGQDLRKVYKEKIFDPLEIKDWLWEGDSAGTLAGAYYFYTSLKGLSHIGELFLGKGTFRGQKIFNEDFWEFMTTVPESFKKNRAGYNSHEISGAHFWLNKGHEAGLRKAWPDAPIDTVAALGHWGQYLAVIPSENV
ncbi:MAG: serine hydrolase, partial [Bdellovibrionales bacterium]|nr:serine hydrolase [Bdellovibrionales bacterium]